eukprot:TRINITY_DN437_c0_g1_i5.p1 TRINITY_DN437_c0_g1~~TRINITY_DN437_c0_g1_i5.p1  ORF type:complete len:119 (+),score=21.40 TRINITY_DN437_c0_g1_i5:199-555(+)
MELLDESGAFNATRIDNLPSWVRHLSFVSNIRCTAIGDGFLKGRTSLRTVDFSGLPHVTRVGHQFLSQCTSLTSVHLPEDLQIIGDDFLSGCDSLPAMDVSRRDVLPCELLISRVCHT